MAIFLLILSVLAGCCRHVFAKFTESSESTYKETFKTNVLTFSFGLIATIVYGLITEGFSSIQETFKAPALLAILYALTTLLAQVFLVKASSCGSVSLSTLFASCGFIIPSLFGCVFYNESINLMQGVGLLMVVVSFVLSIKIEKSVKINLKWLILALLAMVSAGFIGVVQKIFTTEYKGYDVSGFINLSFIFVIIESLILWLVLKFIDDRKPKTLEYVEITQEEVVKIAKEEQKRFLCLIPFGVSTGIVHVVNTYLSGVLPSVVFFPIVNGGVIILTAIVSLVLFKEKLTFVQKLGILVGIIAILVITFA